ncbi:peptide deformylase [bacterium (Candidatus Blackallbacteria) CG17_big_fil_post_rev_8_21_14_2_50_48_46]|uniref:Peptide deformylase n=1 Tax=bacterium (Candidatus Blackallbacteria) CG17_big_fil_post_rev_8_21_14_2_50_48_46 TaxID=2014261 RepID=A0A2M7G8U4_9BACT|nr:MAG: peptide deformylase [bacterium (Candidatus Blackallbacteria) CG18_big_fil_WC_8_21_14_2_50_49_26]PIW18532.1 MAG: peptide deformylase [bacterium (Candidatus Blackallbacteria) CG17_big_fil_post_rev_8_21_14_2_50_48_46]PIW46483.1 MAG: peptide deformylase [bacterium (Candidatus Blackallbacteria) CG13_big_fil_rev_8_21_14_2_50_49_14]
MAIREVLTAPDPRLRQQCKAVQNISEVQELIQDLLDTMHASGHSVGIAAPQIGVLERVIVIDCTKHVKKSLGPLVLVNPVILQREDSYAMREGCMSLPDFLGPVTRARRIKVSALNREGQTIEIQAAKFEAVVIQHEIDHLDGILFIDRVSSPRTELIRRSEQMQKPEA